MNNEEAKLILRAYRPGGQDATDPFFAEALAQIQRDPELQQWFAKEQAFDLRMRDKLQEAVPVPTGFKNRSTIETITLNQNEYCIITQFRERGDFG